MLALAPVAAADQVYWGNNAKAGGPQGISYASLDGSGGAELNGAGAMPVNPVGSAIDTATGRIYWVNFSSNSISFAKLEGSGGGRLSTAGATMDAPAGVAVDPAGGRIYWPNSGFSGGPQGISYAKLDGSGGGGNLNTAGATVNFVEGLAIDPAAGMVYWSNTGLFGGLAGISYAKLDGSGGGNVNTAGATVTGPFGLALDPVAGRVYWANYGLGGGAQGISYANLDGSGGGDLDTSGATVNSPVGVAIDPAVGKLYWANSAAGGSSGPQGLSYANLDGSGAGDLGVSGATLNNPGFPSLLKAPLGNRTPELGGGHSQRSLLSCTQGSWAVDLQPAQLYRAPTTYTYSWSRNGAEIAGESRSSYRPHAVGSYRCTVTAHNQAGGTPQSSSPHAAFRLAKVVKNKRRGTAKLIVKVPSRGKLTLSGKGLKNRTRRPHRAGRQKHLFKAALPIRAKGQAKRRLTRTGHTMLKLAVKFKPNGGDPGTLTRRVTLRLG